MVGHARDTERPPERIAARRRRPEMRSTSRRARRSTCTPLPRGTRGTGSTRYRYCRVRPARPCRLSGLPDGSCACTGADRPGLGRNRRGVGQGEGVRQPTIAGASRISWSFASASTMNNATSTRRVRLPVRMGSPTCGRQTGRPWRSPSSRSLPRTHSRRGGDDFALGDSQD